MLSQDYLNLRLIRLKPTEAWTCPGEGLSFIFPKAGAGRYRVGAIEHVVSPGDVLICHEEADGELGAVNGKEMVFWSFSLRLEHLYPLFAGHEISLLHSICDSLRGVRRVPASTALAAQCQRMILEVPPQFNLDHRSALLRVAAAILAEEFAAAHGHRAGYVRVEDHLLQVFENLSAEDLLTISIPELADRFGCSRRHLNRLFHQYFGFSVAALRMEMRLLKAVSLLRDPDAKVISVAERSGFNHLGLFNTCFKRRFGSTPSQWRSSNAQSKGRPIALPIGLPQGTGELHGGPGCPLQSNGLCPWSGKSMIAAPVQAKLATPSKPGNPQGLTALPTRKANPGPGGAGLQQGVVSGVPGQDASPISA